MIKQNIQLTNFQTINLLHLHEDFCTDIEQFILKWIDEGIARSEAITQSLVIDNYGLNAKPPLNIGYISLSLKKEIFDALTKISKKIDMSIESIISFFITVGLIIKLGLCDDDEEEIGDNEK